MDDVAFTKVRLEHEGDPNRRRWNLVIPIVGFIVSVLAGVAISHYSPNVFETSYKHVSLPKKEEHKWNVQVDNLKPGNQQLLLLSRQSNPSPDKEISVKQTCSVEVWGSKFPLKDKDEQPTCPNQICASCSFCEHLATLGWNSTLICEAGEEFCGWETNFYSRFLAFPTYYVEVDVVGLATGDATSKPDEEEKKQKPIVQFYIYYKSAVYSGYELIVHSYLFFITMAFMFLPKIGFFMQILRVNPRFWSKQQKYIALLLVGLLFYNSPLFSAPALSFSHYTVYLYELSVMIDVTFVCLLLFFWLSVLIDMVEDTSTAALSGNRTIWYQRRSKSFYLTMCTREFSLVASIWLLSVLAYSNAKFHEATGSPLVASYFLSQSLFYNITKGIKILCGMIYFVWILVLIFRATCLTRALSFAYYIIYGTTIFTLACTCSGLFLQLDMFTLKSSLFFSFLYSGYVLTLAWCYTPVGVAYGKVDTGTRVELTGVEDWIEDDTLSDGEGSFDHEHS